MNNDFDDKLPEDLESEDDASGESSVSGSAPDPDSDDDTAAELADVIGNEPEPGKPFSLADEVEKDEMERRGIDPKDMGIDD